ncbi:hypothetical protein CU048_06865 [Beijerinckiaceae bacterium]|nr:hypothetical protein CU048_06865 [Beijerinckiaceae bacterium]
MLVGAEHNMLNARCPPADELRFGIKRGGGKRPAVRRKPTAHDDLAELAMVMVRETGAGVRGVGNGPNVGGADRKMVEWIDGMRHHSRSCDRHQGLSQQRETN